MVDTLIGTNSSNYTLVSADLGATIYCRVIGTNVEGSASADSNVVGPVTGTPPVTPVLPANTVAPVVGGGLQVGSSLSTTGGTWTGTPTPTLSYQWFRAPSTAITGAMGSIYTLVAGDVGLNIYCQVTGTNTAGNAIATSNTVGPVVTAPSAPVIPANLSLPLISGSIVQGSALTTTNGTWSNSPTSYSYQWYRSPSTIISGAVNINYVTTSVDVGRTIYCKVTARNAAGQASVDSAATAAIVRAAPTMTAIPLVSGPLEVGLILSCTTGTWTNSPTSFAYQWVRAPSTNITGATTNTYTTTIEDDTFNVFCKVTATNSGGSTTANSNQVGPIFQVVFEAETDAWENAVALNSGSVDYNRKILVNRLIAGLKADGVWTRLDRLWLFAAENTPSAEVDLRNLQKPTPVGAPVFMPNRGYATSNGNYFNANYITAATGSLNQSTQNSTHIASWVQTATTVNGAVILGSLGTRHAFIGTNVSGNWVGQIHVAGMADVISTTPKTSIGLLMAMREGSGSLSRNDATIGSNTNLSSAPASVSLFIGCRNNNGTPEAFAEGLRTAAVSVGMGFTATQRNLLYNRLRTYMTGVGVA